MMYRSDLALEAVDSFGSKIEGLLVREEKKGPITMTVVEVLSQEASQQIGKPLGKYCTLQLPPFSDDTDRNGQGAQAAAHILREMLPEKGEVLVMGLGNRSLTADALGPKAADRILATRHIEKELRRIAGLERVRPVSVCSPGVLGMTGLETREILLALVRQVQPAAVIAIDALAAADLNRMGCTVQITDSGIAPGSGESSASAQPRDDWRSGNRRWSSHCDGWNGAGFSVVFWKQERREQRGFCYYNRSGNRSAHCSGRFSVGYGSESGTESGN